MRRRWFSGWRRPALPIGLGVFGLVLLAGLFVASGLYNVAARTGHWEITRAFLEFALRRSVATHSLGTEVPPLDDRDLVALGAGHFASGCAPCHGAPDRPANPIVRQMLPQPPDLSHAAQNWRDRELFWIVRNGLKYTGMPAWAAPQRVDEVWSVVAFLRQLPAMTPGRYAEMTRGDPPGRAWRIGIRDPYRPGVMATLELAAGESVSTSGDYERMFDQAGTRYHHILDPRTGYPVAGLHAVTVVHADAAVADAASTALFVAGPGQWRQVAAALGIAQVLVVQADGTVAMTPAMAGRVRLVSGWAPPLLPADGPAEALSGRFRDGA